MIKTNWSSATYVKQFPYADFDWKADFIEFMENNTRFERLEMRREQRHIHTKYEKCSYSFKWTTKGNERNDRIIAKTEHINERLLSGVNYLRVPSIDSLFAEWKYSIRCNEKITLHKWNFIFFRPFRIFCEIIKNLHESAQSCRRRQTVMIQAAEEKFDSKKEIRKWCFHCYPMKDQNSLKVHLNRLQDKNFSLCSLVSIALVILAWIFLHYYNFDSVCWQRALPRGDEKISNSIVFSLQSNWIE